MGLNSFSTALSGLQTSTMGLSVVGNNLANLNTIGFKESNISFSEVFGQAFSTPGGNVSHVGLGSQVQSVSEEFSQGGVQTSSNPLDVAIQGQGLMVLNDKGVRLYSRAGNLHLDSGGNLVAAAGQNIMGYVRNQATGMVDQSLGLQSIQVANNLVPPTPTTQFELGMNLDAQAPTGTTFSTNVQLIDSQGTTHLATLAMQKDVTTGSSPVTRWRFDLTIPTSETAGASPTSTTSLSLLTGTTAASSPTAGALVFDGNGVMTSSYLGPDPATNPPLADLAVPPGSVTLPTLANGATLSPITWKLISNSSSPNLTGFASTSVVNASDQNGSASGTIANLSILSDGTLSAVFNNGKTVSVAQIVLAQFSNVQGLTSEGGGLYIESSASGEPRVGAPGDSGQGRLVGGALEQSNVDLATELTKIIMFQRGYQANAKMITTADQILQDTLNIKQ